MARYVLICQPSKHLLKLRAANATGVYSGVVAQSNGNSKDNANLVRIRIELPQCLA